MEELTSIARVFRNSDQPRTEGLLLFLLWWFDEEDVVFGEVTGE